MSTYMKLRNQVGTGRGGNLDRIFQRMGDALGKSGERGRIQLRVIDDKGWLHRCLCVDSTGCEVSPDFDENPDLEVIAQDKIAMQILKGTLSPVDAVLQGKMRVRGDIELAKRVLKQLGTGKGKAEC